MSLTIINYSGSGYPQPDNRWQVRMMALFIAMLLPLELFAETIANNISIHYSEYPPAYIEAGADKAQIARGEYLVKLGDCMACHTDTGNGGTPFAGGLRIETPFGALFAPNITPDQDTGIGDWSEDDFVTAMREGISPGGSYYYPVFPYNYYNRMSREDVLATIFTRPPSKVMVPCPPRVVAISVPMRAWKRLWII